MTVAVVLDFVNPIGSGRRPTNKARKAWVSA
jgi:hypothetical protein